MHDDGARFEINWLLLRQRSHYAREFWKHSFIFTVRPTVHTSRHENGAFRKRSSNRKNLKTAAFGLIRRKKKKRFENRAFRKWRHHNHVISLIEFSSNTNSKWPVIVAFCDSSCAEWTQNISRMRFQSETSVFKFLRGSVKILRCSLFTDHQAI